MKVLGTFYEAINTHSIQAEHGSEIGVGVEFTSIKFNRKMKSRSKMSRAGPGGMGGRGGMDEPGMGERGMGGKGKDDNGKTKDFAKQELEKKDLWLSVKLATRPKNLEQGKK